MKITSRKITGLLSSKRFFVFVLVFFAFESLWIAFSALYPQAFDENYHFGLIQVYAHHWSPFITRQPAGANIYGAVARDPSYLYHYLMSFPYRFFTLFTHSQTTQVILFRLIDIGLFGIGLVLFRRILLRVGMSRSLTNVSLFLFVLIPIVPQLAAQVNYDDLLFPLVAWVCLQTFDITDQIRKRMPSSRSILMLAATCIFATLVKYAFLPIFFTIVIFLLAILIRTYKRSTGQFFVSLLADFKTQPWSIKIILPLIVLLGLGMLWQREGVNFIKYHTIVPDCAKVLNVKACSEYSPWYFNYTDHQQVLSGALSAPYSLGTYTKQWFYWMWYRLFFAVNGAESNFISYPPLPLPGIAAGIVALAGVVAAIRWRRKIFYKNLYITFLLIVCVVYALALFTKGFATYKYTSVLENMNGRYLLPILPLFVAIVGLALSLSLRRNRTHKAIIAVIVLLLFLQGGGLLTFLMRSDESWYWPNHTVQKVNNAARTITKPVIIKNQKVPSSNIAPSIVN